MKKIFTYIAVLILLSSCADSKVFEINNEKVEIEPYGWANAESVKDSRIVYEVCVGNVIWSIIGFETIIVPIWLTGYSIYEPVRLKTELVTTPEVIVIEK